MQYIGWQRGGSVVKLEHLICLIFRVLLLNLLFQAHFVSETLKCGAATQGGWGGGRSSKAWPHDPEYKPDSVT